MRAMPAGKCNTAKQKKDEMRSIIDQHIQLSKKYGIEHKTSRNRHTGAGFTLRELKIIENSNKRFKKLKLKKNLSFENVQKLNLIQELIEALIQDNLT